MRPFNSKRVAAKMFAIEAGIALLIIAPLATYAAFTISKSPAIHLGSNDASSNGLVGWWTFDGSDMLTNVADKSGNGNNGYLVGFTSTTTDQGRVGEALLFDGNNDSVTIPSISSLNPTSLTVAFWFKQTASCAVFRTLMRKYSSTFGAGNGWDTIIEATGKVTFDVGTSVTNQRFFSTASVVTNQWAHWVFTYDATTGVQNVYKDGVYIDGQTVTPGTITTNTDPVTIAGGTSTGCQSGGYAQGDFDDVRMYSRAVSATDVNRLYGLGATSHVSVSPPTGLGSATDANGLSNGLVGWWTFDGKNMLQNSADSSGSGNAGRLVNFTSTTTVEGKVGQALNFDGVDDYVIVPAASSINNLGPLSYSLWIKPTAAPPSGGAYILAKNGASGTANSILLRLQTGAGTTLDCSSAQVLALGFVKRGASPPFANQCTADNALVLNTWQHIVVTWDGSGGSSGVHIYKNGVELSYASAVATSGSITSDSSLDLYMGNRAAVNQGLTGAIDDVRIYNRVLSATEITKLYGIGATTHVAVTPSTGLAGANQPSGASNGLVGWWTFDGKNMLQNVADSSGSGNAGFLTGFTSTSTAVAEGKIGQALTFDGVDDKINVGSGSSLAVSSFTASAWIYPRSIGGGNLGRIVDQIGAGTGFIFSLCNGGANPSNSLKVDINNGTAAPGVDIVTGNSNIITLNKWQHVVLVVSGTNVTFYVNGVNAGTGTFNQTLIATTNATYIGGRAADNARQFDGTMDDVRIYNRAMSAAEVLKLYQTGK